MAMVALATGMVLVVGALGQGVPACGGGPAPRWWWPARSSPGRPTPGGGQQGWAHAPTTRPNVPAGVFWGTTVACAGALALVVAGSVAGGQAGTRLLGGGVLMGLGIFGYAVAYRMVEAGIEPPAHLAAPRGAFHVPDDREDKKEWVQWVDYYSTTDPLPNGPLVTWTRDRPPAHLDPGDHDAVHPRPRLVWFTMCRTVRRWLTCLGRARTRQRPPDDPPRPSRPAYARTEDAKA